MEIATFGAGCFWGVELAFQKLNGVSRATSGYMGGQVENPTYQQVCADTTGHAEVVQVEYDPQAVSYRALLELFFIMHDATQVNRQGPDIGSQYRSAIFTHTPDQETEARKFIDDLNASDKYQRPIATTIETAPTFWPAEDYHQKYLEKRGMTSCHF